jgi:hypothetical protein
MMKVQQDDAISIRELVQKIQSLWSYLLHRWVFICLVGMLGASVGFYAAWVTPIKYSSKITFLAEESKSMNGGLASLAGQFGLDFGGASGGGIFNGENLLLFLKSEGLVRETLLTSYDSSGKVTLADQYASVYELKKSWETNANIRQISFSKHAIRPFTRTEDSLLQVVIRSIGKELSVVRPEKKATFIDVQVSTRDEILSKLFVERLVGKGTDRYIQSKTKIKAANVALLQKRADSLGALLNNTTYKAAAAQQSLIDVNPALRTAPVASEISSREKVMLATIFAEVVKNLELAKFTLSQETPVIQIVDNSYFPLRKESESKLVWMILSGMLGVFFSAAYLLAARWWQHVIK